MPVRAIDAIARAGVVTSPDRSVATKILVVVVCLLVMAFALFIFAKAMQGNLEAYRAGRRFEKEHIAKARAVRIEGGGQSTAAAKSADERLRVFKHRLLRAALFCLAILMIGGFAIGYTTRFAGSPWVSAVILVVVAWLTWTVLMWVAAGVVSVRASRRLDHKTASATVD
jgi:hypothetical protein